MIRALDAGKINVYRRLQEYGAVLAVVPKQINDEHERHVAAGDSGRPAGADRTHIREAPFAVNQNIVAEGIDNVRGNEGEHDGANHVHRLQAAAQREIEKQRQKSDAEGFGVGNCEFDDAGIGADSLVEIAEHPDGNEQKRRERDAEIDAVDERAMAILAFAGAEGLRDEGIESEQNAEAKERDGDEDVRAESDGSDGSGAVGQASDHHGVHDGHAHPTELGED